MKTLITTLGLSAILPWFSYAQDSGISGTITPAVSDNATPGITNTDQAAYYATFNQRVLEFQTQFDLLSQLAQEHKKRAQETPHDQVARNQWESGLAQELGDKAAAILPLLNNINQERIAFEKAHPNLVASVLRNFPSGATRGHNQDEIAFLGKLEERIADVQQEMTETIEAGKLYTAQLLTNNGSLYVSKISYLLEANGDAVKKLQSEAFDLELRKLEFRALRRD